MSEVEKYIKSIPDFPQPGIIFRDVTSVTEDPEGMKLAIDEMDKLCISKRRFLINYISPTFN